MAHEDFSGFPSENIAYHLSDFVDFFMQKNVATTYFLQKLALDTKLQFFFASCQNLKHQRQPFQNQILISMVNEDFNRFPSKNIAYYLSDFVAFFLMPKKL